MMTGIQNAYSGSDLKSNATISTLLSSTTNSNIVNVGASIINTQFGGKIIVDPNAPVPVTGACTGTPANAVYFGNTPTYNLLNATGGTLLTSSYRAIPLVNTCNFTCANGYGWNGSACIATQANPTLLALVG